VSSFKPSLNLFVLAVGNMHESCALVGEMLDLSIDSVDLIYNMDSDAETHAAVETVESELRSEDSAGRTGAVDEADLNAAIRGNIDNLSFKLLFISVNVDLLLES
jgi:hypothetical protein